MASCDAPPVKILEPTVPSYCHHSPSNQCNNNHRMHNYTSHPAARLSPAVTHSCTNTRCSRRQRLSNLNRTSAFVCGSLNHRRCVRAAPFLLLNQRDGEEQQVAATLHKYLRTSKGQTVQPGEIHRLEAEESIRFLPARALPSSACTQGTRRSNTSQLLVNG